ncbi:Cytokinesis protein 3 [Madurella fahalii]|uniref:Cytokinesis protein 3 n=1 Tax=Madurella fahalii TaxID=1157608 RepID=A0ABQ0GB55_9PEZI
MVPAPPPLPTRFPCWVRAVYSWGGESKRDLGFIEGDLIECLNAGDGSWWTGRLWRDRRAVGLFPSNFVEMLPDNFRPTSRSTSPMPNSTTPSPKTTPQKSKTFRKPFEAYAKAPHYTTAKIPETYKDGSFRQREPSVNSLDNASAAPSGHAGREPEAMDDVMEQLDALGAGRETASPEPTLDPWSPASFDMIRQRLKKKRDQQNRPQSSMGIPHHVDEGYETYSGSAESSQEPTHHGSYQEQPLPQLSNYVERMESRLRTMHQQNQSMVDVGKGPTPPPKGQLFERPKSSMDTHAQPEQKLRHKKSAYDMGRQVLNRTFTNKTNSTNSSSATQSTDRSLMSGASAGGISATSAGSLARKTRSRAQSALAMRDLESDRPETPFTGVTYHSSHASGDPRSKSQIGFQDDAMPGLGGLVQPKPKKQNFIKRILESAKTGVASTRGSIAAAGASSAQAAPSNRSTPALTSLSTVALPNKKIREHGRETGLGGGVDWVQVRRDVNRSNSLSQNERIERRERCQMLDYPALDPVDELYNSIEGDEGADGMPVAEPINYAAINLSQVDKNSRFITNLPPTTTAITLATTYVCRPYRSDVQRLRAIFTWVTEQICWEEDFDGPSDTRRVIQTKRACAEEYATLVLEMCAAVGLSCEIVRGYLKTPGEIPDVNVMPRSNHWWNAVLVDNEWRIMDCCLASPTNPRRSLYSSASSSSADTWWFLARPTEICWTHIPEHHEQQHICPPVAHEVLLNLPCACPPFFRNGLQMVDYNTSLTRIEDLEMVHVKFSVPPDVEVAAEVEVRAYSRDSDGDFFESGETVKKRALAQAEWFGGVKRYTVKALLPGDEGTGTLKIYAGKRGLMHSIKDIPHPLAFALPIIHTGENPPYEFVTRHPTPHAQRHDIYVVQPQCQRLALNNTFVFAIRQHPSSPASVNPATAAAAAAATSPSRAASPIPFLRPSSAMSMTSSAAGSNPSTVVTSVSGGGGPASSSSSSSKKPAKLAIQTPGGKILRLMRKEERRGIGGVLSGKGVSSPAANPLLSDEEAGDGGVWETIIKCSERGVWRGLVLADRTARWCVFAEWVCEG